jgi:hypothetical protein
VQVDTEEVTQKDVIRQMGRMSALVTREEGQPVIQEDQHAHVSPPSYVPKKKIVRVYFVLGVREVRKDVDERRSDVDGTATATLKQKIQRLPIEEIHGSPAYWNRGQDYQGPRRTRPCFHSGRRGCHFLSAIGVYYNSKG